VPCLDNVRPDLLYREDTTGHILLNVVSDLFLQSCISYAPKCATEIYDEIADIYLAHHPASTFATDFAAETEGKSVNRTFEDCIEIARGIN
jgi:hypothetical protein